MTVPDHRTAPPGGETHGAALVLAGMLITAGVHLALVAFDVMALVHDGAVTGMSDPDGYTWLLRAAQLHETGRWHDPVVHALNAPEGLRIHWTRPLDVLLLAGAWIGSLFTDFPTALHYWGVAIGPALHLACVPLLSWGTRPFLSGRAFLGAAALLALQREVLFAFGAGRADHHGLLVLLLLAVLMALLRETCEPQRRGLLPGAGALCGLALWVGPEGLLITLCASLALGLSWVWQGGERLAALARFCTGLAIASVTALAIERPPQQWLTVDYERLSVAQAALTVSMAAVAWALLASGLGRRAASVGARIGLGCIAVLGTGAALRLAFAGIFSDPAAAMDPLVREQLMATLTAEQPTLPTTPLRALRFAWDMGPGLLAVAMTAGMLLRGGEGARRHLVFAAALIVFGAYALTRTRGIMFLQAASLVPWVELLGALLAWTTHLARRHGRVAATAGAGAFGAALAGHWLVAAVILRTLVGGWSFTNVPVCRMSDIAPHLQRAAGGNAGETIMSDFFRGPEIAYSTAWSAVGSPYNDPHGMRDTFAFAFSQGDDRVARTIARQRRVAYVVYCRQVTPAMRAFFRREQGALITRLFIQRPPRWLEPVPLPSPLLRRFVAYRVRR